MKALWWFKENSVAGMARPGFNGTPWFEFDFDEALLVGWIGQFPSGSTSLGTFQNHVLEYGTKILPFYKVKGDAAHKALRAFRDPAYVDKVFRKVTERSRLLESHEVTENELSFRFNDALLAQEIQHLKEQGIKRVVSLTERHNSKSELELHFHATHISINDLGAPTLEQAQQLAEILREAKLRQEKVAVHCLAGIGRTSTMLISAHMLLGEPLGELKTLIARQNPLFVFTGGQAEFIRSLSERLS